ncbi:MAG: hypothetical protein GYB53_18385 [Rhodobacteraceae bacterium]|nr:hypothetical protein [Paracoccaceae bacterium]MBR9819380.1 hypothetical protein [Paracoccaceae bacterium]
MRRIGVSILIVMMIAGCEEHDLRGTNASYLEPLEQSGSYRWKTIADNIYPVNGEKAEAARLRQLGEALRINSACSNGYDITDRQATMKRESPWGGIYDVFYTVRCK